LGKPGILAGTWKGGRKKPCRDGKIRLRSHGVKAYLSRGMANLRKRDLDRALEDY
jgi:hypothetical protein